MRLRFATRQLVALAIVLAVGFGTVWALVVLWTSQVVAQAFGGGHWQYLRIRSDGTPLVVSYQGVRSQMREYRDLAGNLVSVEDESKWLNLVGLSAHLGSAPPRADVPWSERVRGYSDNRNPPVWWFAISDGKVPGSWYFAGYDSFSNARLGFIGSAGLREEPLPPDERLSVSWSHQQFYTRLAARQQPYPPTRFPYSVWRTELKPEEVPPWYLHVLTDQQTVYQIDLSAQTAKALPIDAPVVGLGLLAAPYSEPLASMIYRLAVRGADEVRLLDRTGQTLKRWIVPAELRSKDLIWGETTSGDAVAYTSAPGDDLDPFIRYTIDRLDTEGTVKEHHALTLPLGNAKPYMRFLVGLIFPSPIETDAAVGIQLPLQFLDTGHAAGYGKALQRAITGYWPSLAIAQAVGLIFALLCYRRQRQYAVRGSSLVLWPLFVFACGLPGWIGYRYSRWWPVLERCPTCGNLVPQDRSRCRICDADFPLPAPKGTEVFA